MNKYMKDAQCLQSLEKSKLTSQRVTRVYLLEWTKLEWLTIPSDAKDGKELELSYTAVGNVKWYNHFRKQEQYFQKLGLRISKDQSILPLSIYTREMKGCVHTQIYTLISSNFICNSQINK